MLEEFREGRGHDRKGEGGRGEENEKWREGGYCV